MLGAGAQQVGPGAERVRDDGGVGDGLNRAVVTGLEDDAVRLEISPGTTIKVARAAVARVVEPVGSRVDDEGTAAGPEPTHGG